MPKDIASAENVAQLREFAGPSVPDSALRAALVRAGGDLNNAAAVLLADGTLGKQEAPILVAQHTQSPSPSPQQLPVPRAARPDPTNGKELRRLAWRKFYKDNWQRAMDHCATSDKKTINDHIVSLWKNLGAAGRDALTRAAAGDGVPAVSVSPVSEKEVNEQPRQQQVQAERADESADVGQNERVNKRPGTQIDDEVQSVDSKPRAKRPRCESADADVVQEVPLSVKRDETPVQEWPKKLVSRLCAGTMLSTGKKLLSVNDELVLQVPPPPRTPAASKRDKGKGGSHASQVPAKIVRFLKNDRELGRLASDISQALAPAMQTGFISTTCKVVSAPKVLRMFSEVFLEVTIYLQRDAFDGDGMQQVVQCGDSAAVDGTNSEEKAASAKGIDIKRFNIVHLITSLNLCQPPEQPKADFPAPSTKTDGEPGEVTEEGAEAYYKSVDAIQEEEAKAFVPPKNLTSTLREYQRAGVGWMVAREQSGYRLHKDQGNVDVMIDPLWKRKMFPDGTVFFVNATTGGLSLDSPMANSGGPFGGILADEMGLGKTVQCIACIVHDLEQQKTQRNGCKGEKSETPNGVERLHGDSFCDEDVNSNSDKVDHDEGVSEEEDEVERSEKKVTRRSSRHRKNRVRESKSATGQDQSGEECDDDDEEDFEANEMELENDDGSSDEWSESRHSAAKKRRNNVRVLDEMMTSARAGDVRRGGTLIVCPMSLITQWMSELSLHVSPNFLRVATHYGQSRGSGASISLQYADVVVTSYGIIASECADEGSRTTNGKKGRRERNGAVFELNWRRIILDEAHMIKGRTTKWARAAYKLKGERRWCVTGTVIHNHINDVYSLLHFLQMKPWSAWALWTRAIEKNIEAKDVQKQRQGMCLVRDIVSSVTLRRKKSTRDSKGRCIVVLPKKTVEIVKLRACEEERDFYTALHQRSKVQFDKYVAQGKLLNNFSNVLELLLRLRQACDHPYLVLAAPSKDNSALQDGDKMFRQFINSGSSTSYVEKMLHEAASGQLQQTRECVVCLDVMEDAVAPKQCGHAACRMCLLQALQRSNKCPVCRTAISKASLATLPRASRFSIDLERHWRSSAKIDALLADVAQQSARRKRNARAIGKCVIFSQFTSMLDLVGVALGRVDAVFLRIDGQTSQRVRAQIVHRFATESELAVGAANVLLVSLRAGGVGLNLVAASLAVLLDVHWNPQVDAQAQDRIHRYGQTRDVWVKRYVIEDSVEERLLQVQRRKKGIAEGALDPASEEDRREAKISEWKWLFSTGT